MEISNQVSDEEGEHLAAAPDIDILELVRNSSSENNEDKHCHVVRPAQLVSSLGLSIEDATRELCGLLSAVGGGEDGASFVFEKVELPDSGAATSMVFTFPHDFEKRALRHRRNADFKQRLRTLSIGIVKATKIFTAFGLIISLAVLIIAGICLLVAAVIAMARGGHGGGGGHRNHPLMHRVRFLFFELRQILWLYAICGGSMGGHQDPFLREVAGDMAMMMSVCCGNPMHIFFWMRMGRMSRRWRPGGEVARRWGGSTYNNDMDGIAMMRRGTWGDDNDTQQSQSTSLNRTNEQRGLLSIAVEFLFGPSDDEGGNASTTSRRDLERWKFRASIIIALSSSSGGNGVSLRELLPYVDNPPKSADDASAVSEAMKIVTYFNGKPVDCDSGSGNCMEARFCFPELMAEMNHDINATAQKLFSLGSSEFAGSSSDISSILYKEDEDTSYSITSSSSDGTPLYLYERTFVLTGLSKEQFGQCVFLGLLNFVGVVWIQNALSPGGLLQLPVAAAVTATAASGSSRRRKSPGSDTLIVAASFLILGLFKILRFYAGLFFAIPLSRLVIILLRNYGVQRRNERRQQFI
uniref:Uncharacterized protein n=1 Tax=Skeletonema marinoi TaxID=267567 RepID=A0A7S2LYC4_9STRA|mmetsp:Transcript_3178/g.5225  ORF Transcript_3178/g.5225 Transcript_3178/m.5225 type:complete len:581 (+) Transcript_3178:29-1771(+)